MAGSAANKVIVDVELRAQLDQMRSGVKEIEGLFKNLNLSPSKNANITQLFADMKKELGEIEALTDGGKIKGGNFSKLEKSVEKVTSLYSKLGKEITSLSGKGEKELQKLFPPEIANAINQASAKLKEYHNILKQVDNDSGLTKKQSEFKQLNKELTQTEEKITEYEEALERLGNKDVKIVSTQEFNTAKKELDEAKKKVLEYEQQLKKLQDVLDNHTVKTRNGKETQTFIDRTKQIEELKRNLEQARQEEEKLNNAFGNLSTESVSKIQSNLQSARERAGELSSKVLELDREIQKLSAENPGKAFEIIRKEIENIQGLDLDWTKITNIDELEIELSKKIGGATEEVLQKIKEIFSRSEDLAQPFKGMAQEIQRVRQTLNDTASSMKQIEQLAQRGLYFFGLTNQVNLFKRAVRSAFDTVKELDKAMTETAVVTDFSVGDMWQQLPEYTKVANEYNATLKDAYDVMTLYYQQGLETNQVFEVGTETMKMARIAGLEYGEATDRMTNALRGFNMEINNTNAEHVADVYSQLAAMSASNVDELSVAMTKVASLANSANMSFDNTAAFLAQIIETTRESAETAGTALKTVVARFSEVKKLYSEGDLIGDVDGEEVNINKVGAALRAAGVDLNEFATGAKGLDEIFIELANKWDSLDLLTQRYIATMAAGSRQQSRFLALMSNNARLTELLNGAYNASGASSEQFAKTQESLESKLNNLKNAWDQFLMGITNSSVIKGAVDLLTKLITTVNKLLEAVGKMGSIPKALASIGLIAGVMKGGEAIIRRGSIYLSKFAAQATNAGSAANVAQGAISGLATKIAALRTTGSFKIPMEMDDTVIRSQWQQLKASLSKDPIQVQTVISGAGGFSEIEATKKALEEAAAKKTKALANQAAARAAVEEAEAELLNAKALDASEDQAKQEEIALVKLTAAKEALAKADGEVIIAEDAEAKAHDANEKAINRANTSTKSLKTSLKELGVTLGVNLLAAAPGILALGLAIAGLAAYKHFDGLNQLKESADKAKESADSLKEAADRANNELSELQQQKSSYDETLNSLNNLTKGTNEWSEALAEANVQTLELLTKYKDLEYEIDRFGQITIKEDSYNKLLKDKQNQALKAQGNALLAQSESDYANTLYENEKNRRQKVKDLSGKTFSGYDVGKAASVTGTAAVGTVGSVALGLSTATLGAMAAGAASGSVVPIIGTVIGALAGLAAGAIATGIAIHAENKAFNELEASHGKYKDEYENYVKQLKYEEEAAKQVKIQRETTALQTTDEDKNKYDISYKIAIEGTNESNSFSKQLEDEIKSVKWNDETKQKWAIIQGYEYSNGKFYDSEGTEIDIKGKKDQIKRDVAVNALRNKKQTQADNIDQVLKKYKKQDLAEILSNDTTLDLAKTRQFANLTEEDLTALGLKNNKEFQNLLKSKFNEILSQQAKNRSENIAIVVQALQDTSKNGFNETQEKLLEAIGQLDNENTTYLNDFLHGVKTYATDEELNNILNKIDFQEADLSKLAEIDFSNPIKAFNGLKDAGVALGDEIEALSLQSRTTYLFENLIDTEEFEDTNKEIEELIKNNGRLTSKNVKELAKEYDILGNYIQSATDDTFDYNKATLGLAKAFTMIKKGQLAYDQLTDSILKSLGAVKDYRDYQAEAYEFIDSYNAGRSDQEPIDFYTEQLESLQKLIEERSAYGDDQTLALLGSIYDFSNGAPKTDEEVKKYYNQAKNWTADNGTSFLQGMANSKKANKIFSEAGASFRAAEGGVDVELGNLTSEQFIKAAKDYAEEQGMIITDAYAEALLLEFQSTSATDKYKMLANDYKSELEKGYGSDRQSKNKFINEDEIGALSLQYNIDTDQIQKDLENKGFVITPTIQIDEDQTEDEINESLSNILNDAIETYNNNSTSPEVQVLKDITNDEQAQEYNTRVTWKKLQEEQGYTAYSQKNAYDKLVDRMDLNTLAGTSKNSTRAYGQTYSDEEVSEARDKLKRYYYENTRFDSSGENQFLGDYVNKLLKIYQDNEGNIEGNEQFEEFNNKFGDFVEVMKAWGFINDENKVDTSKTIDTKSIAEGKITEGENGTYTTSKAVEIGDHNKAIVYNEVVPALKEEGYSNDEIQSMIDASLETNDALLEYTYEVKSYNEKDNKWETKEVTEYFESVADALAAEKEAQDEADLAHSAEIYAQAISDALDKVEITADGQTITTSINTAVEEANTETTPTANTEQLVADIESVTSNKEEPYTASVDGKLTQSQIQGELDGMTGLNVKINGEVITETQEQTGTPKKYVPRFEYGTHRKGEGKTQTALVGEVGPELIQRDNGTAYLSGVNGPEMTILGPNDVVYPTDETKNIFRRGGQSTQFNRYEKGKGPLFNRYAFHTIKSQDPPDTGGTSDKTTEDNTDAVEANTKATQDLANIERDQSKLQKQLSELQEGGIYTAPWQLKNLNEQRQLLKKQQKANKEILNQKQEEAKKLEEANAQWDQWLEKNEDGSYSYKEGYDDAVKNGTVDQTTRDNLSQLVSKGNEVADQQTTVDDYAYQVEEIRDQEYQVYADWIDQGVDWTNQAIEGAGQVAQSVLQMIEKVAQSMVDGFKSFLGWLTIRIDDEHDIGELNESLKNRKDLLDWEFDKYAEKDFDYTKGTNSKSQENLFENINDAAQNVLIRLQNQRRLYENSFRQLEDLGTNINSDIEASLEELYEALYGIDGVFTKINDKVQYLENRFERATKWNLTNIREMDPIQKINEWFGTNFEDTLGEALKPLNIFDGTLIDTFFKKSLQQIAGLEITEYRLGNVGESLLQKVANFFYELSPKFDADYQIVNKSELVDALNQKMQTIITNDTITSQFVQNYLDYLTEIESQMESEVDNIRNAESEILSLYDEMTEILEKGKDEYGELEQQIYDAIVSEKESIKEELEELNDNITDADSDLINVLKNNLEQMRQMRENDKTESDLQDKEARLAYLRQDTSGANKQEILKLEKELKEGQQSYTDKLIDQKINELEKQNEEAAEQRQVQIDLLQEEINNTKNIWEKVKSMMDAISGYGSWDDILKGEIKREAYQNIIDQLKKASDFDEMSSFAQDNQINDWGILIRKASLYGTMLKDEYQEAYNDLKILRDILDQDTKLPSDNAADSMWHNYVAFSNLETAVQDNTEAVKNAVSVINRIVDAKTLSFDETGSIFKKATESGATIQALSGLEDAVKNFANDMASGLPGILTQVTTGAGNLAKGLMKGMGAAADSGAGAMTGDIKLGDLGEAAGMVMEGVSNFFAAGVDAISLMCDIIGDTSPGFTDMGVAAGTMIANWLDNAFEEVDDHLRENVGYILDEMYGEVVDGQRLGGYYEQIGEEIAGQKEALAQYFDDNGKDGTDFVKKLYAGIEERYKDINDQISKLDGNDIEGFNKQYSRFLALQKILERIGHTETIETYTSNSISNLNKWAGEIGSLFAELSEKERQIVVDAINNAIYDVIKDETLASGDPKSSIWESNLKFKTSDIKYYNDIYKEFVDNVNYSVDAIDEAITAINSVFYDPYENEYTSPSAQLLIRKLEQLEGKRAEQEVQFEKSVWETFIDRVEDAWGEFGNHILQIVDKGKVVIERIATFLEKTFGAGSRWADWIDAIDNSHALGGAIRQTERALVGELGPELVQHANGTATLVGRHGPEVTNLSAGDQVYTAEQTKKILRGGGAINFNRFAEGTVGNFIGRAPVLPGLTSIDITTPTRALASDQTNRENHFNLNLSLEDLTVDSIERVDEVANRVWDKLNSTISNAMWPYNKL